MLLYTRLAEESEAYRAQREELREAELALMRQREEVAALRRKLPEGPVVQDYEFVEGPADLDHAADTPSPVRLSELFTAPGRPLIVFQMMFGKEQADPCPMCSMWVDGFNGIARHITQNADFVVAAAANLPALRTYARTREWSNLRLLSCGDNTFKYDLGSEDEQGNQETNISVFNRDAEGAIRHSYSVGSVLDEKIPERGIDLLSPVWHLLDLLPQGRGDWYPSRDYPAG